jgi:hypothetical protein
LNSRIIFTYCSLYNESEFNEKFVLEVARVTEAVMGSDFDLNHYFVQRFKDEGDPVTSRLLSYCICFVIKVTESEAALGERLVINIYLINLLIYSILPHRKNCLSTTKISRVVLIRRIIDAYSENNMKQKS